MISHKEAEMFENILYVGFGLFAGAVLGVWIHGFELMIKARTYDLVNGQWVKRG